MVNHYPQKCDAETFDYSHPLEVGEGFKISIHHHFDRPTIALQELNVALGQEMQEQGSALLTKVATSREN